MQGKRTGCFEQEDYRSTSKQKGAHLTGTVLMGMDFWPTVNMSDRSTASTALWITVSRKKGKTQGTPDTLWWHTSQSQLNSTTGNIGKGKADSYVSQNLFRDPARPQVPQVPEPRGKCHRHNSSISGTGESARGDITCGFSPRTGPKGPCGETPGHVLLSRAHPAAPLAEATLATYIPNKWQVWTSHFRWWEKQVLLCLEGKQSRLKLFLKQTNW